MALPILYNWKGFFTNPHEGLGSSYERIILNNLLMRVKAEYDVQTVLETPIFGFTGISGLNSVALARAGCRVTLMDHDRERVGLIGHCLDDLKAEVTLLCGENYVHLPFVDKGFDLSWNFSALWFVEDLETHLKELDRLTSKVILLCVPNQAGIGFRWQKAHTEIPPGLTFHPEFINPCSIHRILKKLGWLLVDSDFIDCPPWPDIGMSKENFLSRCFPWQKSVRKPKKPAKSVTILDYYRGRDPGFADRMLRYSFLEKHAPRVFKIHWAHHYWMLFSAPVA